MWDIVEHTLKNPKTGQWSRKNLTSVLSLFFAMAYSLCGLVYDKTVHEFVVLGFLSLSGGMLMTSAWEKKNVPPVDEIKNDQMP